MSYIIKSFIRYNDRYIVAFTSKQVSSRTILEALDVLCDQEGNCM